MTEQKSPPWSNSLLNLILALLKMDIGDIVSSLAKLARQIKFLLPQQQGIYEVLEYDTQLELKDTEGKTAVYRKQQKVRFLQNNIIAYQDKAWGDGDIFADYKCSPGIPVDRYREGHRYRILISLRGSKDRGDEEEFRIERTIKDGFTNETEDFQVEIDHKTDHLKMSVLFPKSRLPKQVSLIEQNLARVTLLSSDHIKKLLDGRQCVQWETDHPRLFEAYIMRWVW